MFCKNCNHLEADHYQTRSDKKGCAECWLNGVYGERFLNDNPGEVYAVCEEFKL